MKKILIVGSNGIIGKFLHTAFKSTYKTYTLSQTKKGNDKNFIQLDLTKKEEVNNFVKSSFKFDVIIFLVGLAHKKGKRKNIDNYRKINYQTLINLINSLSLEGKVPNKIIFASTISVYGEKFNKNIYLEESNKTPISPYAITKLESEEFLLEGYSDKSWILRFAPIYSSNIRLNINRRTQLKGWNYKVGNGETKLSMCNIQNIPLIINGIINGKVPNDIYNISDSKIYTYNDLLLWQKANWIIPIPTWIIKILYNLSNLFNSIFFKENTLKLMTDNIYPSDKISSFLKFNNSLDDC
jgi:nucleoside-diphosphate-sugar epimerase